mmetsp:Transcript_70728/g.183566  ORF Transcript_70728/g.183566 Transcript_70728/m.183566 type:complete len:315 (-) Transcript_70728:1060-2004(-)
MGTFRAGGSPMPCARIASSEVCRGSPGGSGRCLSSSQTPHGGKTSTNLCSSACADTSASTSRARRIHNSLSSGLQREGCQHAKPLGRLDVVKGLTGEGGLSISAPGRFAGPCLQIASQVEALCWALQPLPEFTLAWRVSQEVSERPLSLDETEALPDLRGLLISSFSDPMLSLMYFRKSTISFTVAVLVPRNSNTRSMKSSKLSGVSTVSPSSPSLSETKMKSMLSTRLSTSTPTSSRALQAAGNSRILENSSLEMVPSPSWSKPPSCITLWSCCFTNVTVRVSRSALATPLTTSQSTPISMFMTVKADKRMKK